MKAFTRLFANLFTNPATSDSDKIYREWDRQRANAYGPNDLAEIDAIFSRAVNSRQFLTFIHLVIYNCGVDESYYDDEDFLLSYYEGDLDVGLQGYTNQGMR